MEQRIHRGANSSGGRIFYPDMPVGHLPQGLRLAMPRNGRPRSFCSKQMPASWTHPSRAMRLCWNSFVWCRTQVEYNTGDGSEQGGAMVLERRPACKPLYTTRLAPFAVYDCPKPARTV